MKINEYDQCIIISSDSDFLLPVNEYVNLYPDKRYYILAFKNNTIRNFEKKS